MQHKPCPLRKAQISHNYISILLMADNSDINRVWQSRTILDRSVKVRTGSGLPSPGSTASIATAQGDERYRAQHEGHAHPIGSDIGRPQPEEREQRRAHRLDAPQRVAIPRGTLRYHRRSFFDSLAAGWRLSASSTLLKISLSF